tara:strand:+ start:41 stop:913 length:873 start_codon:yes stop_codon:yes gene_type:complete
MDVYGRAALHGAPRWLYAWASAPAPEPGPEHRDVLVVAYGLVRSVSTLERTMASFAEHAPRGARLSVAAQCARTECAAAYALLNRSRPQTLTLTCRAPAPPPPRRVCAAVNASATRGAQHAAYYSAHRALVALLDWDADAVVLWRLDTELHAPIDVRALAPWAGCRDCVHVPWMQHGRMLNDRFSYGSAGAMLRYERALVAHMERRCAYGEEAALEAVRASRLRVAFTRARVVRVRADGYVPDVDQAIVLGRIPARSWMRAINTLSPQLRCRPHAAPSPLCTLTNRTPCR